MEGKSSIIYIQCVNSSTWYTTMSSSQRTYGKELHTLIYLLARNLSLYNLGKDGALSLCSQLYMHISKVHNNKTTQNHSLTASSVTPALFPCCTSAIFLFVGEVEVCKWEVVTWSLLVAAVVADEVAIVGSALDSVDVVATPTILLATQESMQISKKKQHFIGFDGKWFTYTSKVKESKYA